MRDCVTWDPVKNESVVLSSSEEEGAGAAGASTLLQPHLLRAWSLGDMTASYAQGL